jgi:ABC-type multidrug transport system, ATPase component
MKTAIDFTNVSKSYGSNFALNGLTVSFDENSVTGLLGPNGAGKSTLFKMMVNLTRPDSGEITILGNAPSWKTNSLISYLPDRGHWYRFQTIDEALSYSNKVLPFFNMNKANSLLKSMGLEGNMKIGSLSKGKEACFMLLLCLARDTKLILLDEPFSGIDLISREHIMQGLIDSMADKNQTIIISTHEIYEAESLFDNVVFIDGGHVIKQGDAETLRSQEGSIESVYRRLYK